MEDIEVFKQIFPEKYFYEFWLSDRRPDNRAFTQLRATTLTRSGPTGFIASCGSNILQTTYELQTTKVRINTDVRSQADHLHEKVNIVFTQEAQFPVFASCVDHLKRLIVKKYGHILSALKINERVAIEVSALCCDDSALGLALLSASVALYDFFRAKLCVDVSMIELLTPLILRAFYIVEKDALLWLFDPTKEELGSHRPALQSALFLSVVSLGDSNKASFEKLSGIDMKLDDLTSLASLVSQIPRPSIRAALLGFLADPSPTQHRLFN